MKTYRFDEACLDMLDENERVLASCTIAREQVEYGDYDASCAVLAPWWKLGEWPNQVGLNRDVAAELLLTTGSLTDIVARAKPIAHGPRSAETLISGAIALFHHIDEGTRAIEARIELGCCYFHQGLLEIAQTTLQYCLTNLTKENHQIWAVAIIRLAIVERHMGRLHQALSLIQQLSPIQKKLSSWTKGRFHTEMANTLKEVGVTEGRNQFFASALEHYSEAAIQFEHLGNSRYAAAVENNRGYLLLTLERFSESKPHLLRARGLFAALDDGIGCAQVDETLAQLYLRSGDYEAAQAAIELAVSTLEGRSGDGLLAEALTTQGLVLCRLGHRQEAKPILERARRVADS